ncbi:uncharacterized protein LOC128888656 [Hylaeus anthracinus]|uniref:uncharacterized protein LOC128888656 n=1 Tax=Hylaeus anthracinus TaxID=313031 RepID=UPI0023BA0094|nr:uncharacterized protein LOC128888656 [Hylaeus anthracinus]
MRAPPILVNRKVEKMDTYEEGTRYRKRKRIANRNENPLKGGEVGYWERKRGEGHQRESLEYIEMLSKEKANTNKEANKADKAEGELEIIEGKNNSKNNAAGKYHSVHKEIYPKPHRGS